MRMLLLGPPGAGKGSQAVGLARVLGVPTISTGDLFRRHVRYRTELGLRVEQIMSAGDYVPDSLTNAIVRARLGRADVADGFILDGYPRTADQVDELDTMLDDLSVALDAVVHLVVSNDDLLGRLAQRAKVEGRADDHPDAIRTRLEVYRGLTEPIVAEYQRRGMLQHVDGEGTRVEVAERMLVALGVES